jgi:hypothetical protein
LLIKYCKGNKANQQEVFSKRHVWIPFFEQRVDIAYILAEVFRGNRDLCDQFPPDMIPLIVQQIREVGYKDRYIDTLDAPLWVGNDMSQTQG